MDDVARVAVLEDPVRRRLYEYVRERGEPVGREEAGEAAGIARSLAAYHLDKLAEQGLLSTTYARPEGRGGPGAGRPAKLYAPTEEEVAVSLPARDYEFAARLLVEAAEEDTTGSARAALDEVARRAGREIVEGEDLVGALRERGYEPVTEEDGTVRLRNCPFHRLAQDHRDVVCGMNLGFVEGMLDGLEEQGHTARLDPRPGLCCVAIRPGRDGG
jgi:predicted ArsR family transcriptional regulator